MILNKKKSTGAIDEKIAIMEKDIEEIKKVYDKCDYKKTTSMYGKIITLILAITTFVVAATTIPSVMNFVAYKEELAELNATIDSYEYVLSAEHTYSTEKKIAQYTSAIEHDKDNPILYFYRATAYFDSSMWRLALSDCNRALEIDKHLDEVYYLKAQCEFYLNDYSSAIDSFNYCYSSENDDESDDNINAYLAYAYYKCENYAQALSHIDRTRQGYFNNILYDVSIYNNFYYIKSFCYYKTSEYDLAKYSLKNVLRNYEYPDDLVFVARYLSDILIALNNPEKAETLNNLAQSLEDYIQGRAENESHLTISSENDSNADNRSYEEKLYDEIREIIYE